MGTCFKADMVRIHKKTSMIVFMCVQMVLFIGLPFLGKMLMEYSEDAGGTIDVMSGAGMASFFIGIPAFLAVFKDDFKSRSMQTAIGWGISRSNLVICRFLEVVIVFVEIYLLQTIAGLIMAPVFGNTISYALSAAGAMWIDLIPTISFIAIAMLVMYASLNTTLGLVIYIVLVMGIVDLIINLLNLIPFVSKMGIDFGRYWVSGAVVHAQNESMMMEIMQLLLIAGVYIVVPVIAAIMLFRKKELEA